MPTMGGMKSTLGKIIGVVETEHKKMQRLSRDLDTIAQDNQDELDAMPGDDPRRRIQTGIVSIQQKYARFAKEIAEDYRRLVAGVA